MIQSQLTSEPENTKEVQSEKKQNPTENYILLKQGIFDQIHGCSIWRTLISTPINFQVTERTEQTRSIKDTVPSMQRKT